MGYDRTVNTRTFNWNEKNREIPVQICISDKLGPLLPHAQKELELMYFYQVNGCSYLCDGQTIPLLSHDLLVVNPGEIHSCGDWGRGCVAACVMVDTGRLPGVSIQCMNFLTRITDHRLQDCFERLNAVLANSDEEFRGKECMVFSILYEILSCLLPYSRNNPHRIGRQEITEILEEIDANISGELSLEELAEKCHLSRDRFCHVFRECTGYSPVKYRNSRRIKRACELLRNTDMTVQEIANACHFCTSSYFSKKFMEEMGQTPSAFRKNSRNSETILLSR